MILPSLQILAAAGHVWLRSSTAANCRTGAKRAVATNYLSGSESSLIWRQCHQEDHCAKIVRGRKPLVKK